jgi:hypothetical protein
LLPFSSLNWDHTLGSVLLIRYTDRNEREVREKKKEAQAKIVKAAGPSLQKNIQWRMDMVTLQRKAAKGEGKAASGGKKCQRGRNQ